MLLIELIQCQSYAWVIKSFHSNRNFSFLKCSQYIKENFGGYYYRRSAQTQSVNLRSWRVVLILPLILYSSVFHKMLKYLLKHFRIFIAMADRADWIHKPASKILLLSR